LLSEPLELYTDNQYDSHCSFCNANFSIVNRKWLSYAGGSDTEIAYSLGSVRASVGHSNV
jgi:hypothetical protein